MNDVYQIKATIKDSKPPIWRRVLVQDSITLYTLHSIINILFNWSDGHLHQFNINGKDYGIPHPDDEIYGFKIINEKRIKLSSVIIEENQHFDYWYDFGDNWHHDVLIEKIMPKEAEMKYTLCIAGKRASPPEDVGGVWGYEYFLEAIGNPAHEEHEEQLEWIGGEFDPEAFDINFVNEELRELTKK